MISGKGIYLKRLTSQMRMRSLEVGTELDGSSPPSVFIGAYDWPNVQAGPLIAPFHGDTSILDTPEDWIPNRIGQDDIVDFRMSLVRGKQRLNVSDVGSNLAEKLRDIALSDGSVDSEAVFQKPPRGVSYTDEQLPYGPSAQIEDLNVGNSRWMRPLERAYYDGDLKAADAVVELHEGDVPFSRIQKALSAGTLGERRQRKLVPTRWSITACDSILANELLDIVRHYEILDSYRVYEHTSLNNYYAIILLPTAWQYEWTEAFLHIIGSEEMVFSDHETNLGKRGYSQVGGCYYSCKFAVLEALERMQKQSGAIILREAYRGYIPLGVYNVRENVRCALKQTPTEFETIQDSLNHLSRRLHLPVSRFMRESPLLAEQVKGTQSTLSRYMSPN